jgi:glutamate-1-semialdehyde 2,1-aminomutase
MSSRKNQIDRTNLATLLERERKTYRENHTKSLELYKGAKNLFGGVPMPWMNKWVGGFP